MATHDTKSLTDRDVEHLVKDAGPMPAQPELDLESLAAPALGAWHKTVEHRRRRRTRRRYALAATVLLTIGGGGVGWRHLTASIATLEARVPPTSADIAETEFTAGSRIRTSESPAERLALRLADGHHLRVDAGTELILESRSHLHLERGAVYIDAAAAHLEVTTANATVHHVGTRFEVRVAEPNTTSVLVRDGKVRLRLADRTVDIDAGHGATAKGDLLERREISTYGPEWQWTVDLAPPFDEQDPTLEAFLAWVGRETGRQIDIDKTLLVDDQGRAITVHIPDSVAPHRALELVLGSAGLQAHLENERFLVTRALPR